MSELGLTPAPRGAMTEALAPLAGIPGVTGAAVFADDDRCLAAALQPPYDEALVERAMRTLRHALLTLNVSFDSEATWSGLFLRCDGGHLVVKRAGEHTILVLGDVGLNVAMVNVGLDVAALKLRMASGVPAPYTAGGLGSQPVAGPDFLDPRAARTVGYGQAPIAAGSPVAPLAMADRLAEITPAAGMVPAGLLEQVLRALARYLGTAARAAIQEELIDLGLAPHAVPLASYSDLVDQLARRIQDPARRTAFLVEAELLGIGAPIP
jgi:predicted regulator of Ras-like GTPase activity (Roadblock/LC7/MglB family)